MGVLWIKPSWLYARQVPSLLCCCLRIAQNVCYFSVSCFRVCAVSGCVLWSWLGLLPGSCVIPASTSFSVFPTSQRASLPSLPLLPFPLLPSLSSSSPSSFPSSSASSSLLPSPPLLCEYDAKCVCVWGGVRIKVPLTNQKLLPFVESRKPTCKSFCIGLPPTLSSTATSGRKP